jgi:hypothetical protein
MVQPNPFLMPPSRFLVQPDRFDSPADYLNALYSKWADGDKHTNSISKLHRIMGIGGSLNGFAKMLSGQRKMKFTTFTSACRVLLGLEKKSEFRAAVKQFFPYMLREAEMLSELKCHPEDRAGHFHTAIMKEMYIRITSGPMKISRIINKWGKEGRQNISRLTATDRFSVKSGSISLTNKEPVEGDYFGYDLFMHNANYVSPEDLGTGANRQVRQSGYLDDDDKIILNEKMTEVMSWFKSRTKSPQGRELISFQCLLRTHD